MASKDPLQALTAVLSVPADSKEQADLLAALRETLEAQPHPIPILCQTLLKTAAGSNDSLLRRWVLELLHFGIARAPLSVDARTNRASLYLVPFFFLFLLFLQCPQFRWGDGCGGIHALFSLHLFLRPPPFCYYSCCAIAGRAGWSLER